jgi:hypothetical protein
MTRVPDYPQLRQFFEGYLHEDFMQEHRSPQGALRAFEADASAAERRRFRVEAKRLLARVESEELDDIRALLTKLGSRWAPRSRAAVAKFLAAAAGGSSA